MANEQDRAMELLGVTVDLQAMITDGGLMSSVDHQARRRAFELLQSLQAGLRGMAGPPTGEIRKIIEGTQGSVVEMLRGVAQAIDNQDDEMLGDVTVLREILVSTEMLGEIIRNYLHIESVVAG